MLNLQGFIQFLSVVFLLTIILFSPIITFIAFILLSYFWSLSITLSICLVYGCWVYFDRHTGSQGGRWSDKLRRLSIFTEFRNYFPLKLIKSGELDPNRNYIFGYHPHGAFALGALGNFGTDATYFSTLFPNIRPHLMLLHLQFLFPFTRELFLNLGKYSTFIVKCKCQLFFRCMLCIKRQL
jgi:2-acylglycerol O-acyltransferase 2